MPKPSSMPRIYPWLVAAFVLVPAVAAWQLQRTQRVRDIERFRLTVVSQSPRLLAGASPAQDIANRAARAVAREGAGFDADDLEHSLGEWRLRPGAVLGYGGAELRDGKLVLARHVLREGAPRVEEGADLLALPELRSAWDRMLREGQGATSAPVAWLLDSPRRVSLVLRVAYGPGPLPTTEAERRAKARGLGFALVDVDEAWDAGAAGIDRRLLAVERMPDSTPAAKGDFERTIGIGMGLGGYTWMARFTPGPDFFPAQAWRTPLLVSLLGLPFAAFTLALARAQSRRREAVEALNENLDARVAALTEELRAENTRLRAAQAETERALAREQESGELKSRVVATISHEFRTPLSVILSSAEILRNYSDRLDPAQRAEQLKSIEESVAGMSSLIQSVLAFSKAGAGRMEFHPERQAPGDLMREVVDEVLSATSRRCPVEFEGRQLDEAGWIDATLLRLILVNLLGNAVKYSAAGSPVELRARRAGDDLVFAVVDHGIGIPEEDLKTLFQSFRRGRNTHGIPGTGLGLSIVKTCVELHRGEVSVQSSPDIGTVFTVTLPVYSEPPPRASSSAPFPAPPASAPLQPPSP